VLLAAAMAFTAYIIPVRRAQVEEAERQQSEAEAQRKLEEQADSIQNTLEVPAIELAVGKQLAIKLLIDNNELGYRISRMRKKFAASYGFVIPEVKVTEDFSVPPRGYQIRVFGTAVATETVSLTDLLVITRDGPAPALPHEEVLEPVFGSRAWRIADVHAHSLKQQGFQSIDAMALVLTHLSEVVRNNLAQLFSYKDMRRLIDGLDKEYMKLVEEISPAHLTFSSLQSVFKLLLAERVSVRNVTQILEAIAEIAHYTKRGDQIVEHVRMRLAQQVCGPITQDGKLKLLRLGPQWDKAFSDAIGRDARGEITEFQMAPAELEEFGMSAKKTIKQLMDQGHNFAVTTAPESRTYVRMVIERLFPALPVLSNLEIARGVEVEVLGAISE
jgi:flagellar biosynthesis protein FlhA